MLVDTGFSQHASVLRHTSVHPNARLSSSTDFQPDIDPSSHHESPQCAQHKASSIHISSLDPQCLVKAFERRRYRIWDHGAHMLQQDKLYQRSALPSEEYSTSARPPSQGNQPLRCVVAPLCTNSHHPLPVPRGMSDAAQRQGPDLTQLFCRSLATSGLRKVLASRPTARGCSLRPGRQPIR